MKLHKELINLINSQEHIEALISLYNRGGVLQNYIPITRDTPLWKINEGILKDLRKTDRIIMKGDKICLSPLGTMIVIGELLIREERDNE